MTPFADDDDFLPATATQSSFRPLRWLNGLALAACIRVLDGVEWLIDLSRRLRRRR